MTVALRAATEPDAPCPQRRRQALRTLSSHALARWSFDNLTDDDASVEPNGSAGEAEEELAGLLPYLPSCGDGDSKQPIHKGGRERAREGSGESREEGWDGEQRRQEDQKQLHSTAEGDTGPADKPALCQATPSQPRAGPAPGAASSSSIQRPKQTARNDTSLMASRRRVQNEHLLAHTLLVAACLLPAALALCTPLYLHWYRLALSVSELTAFSGRPVFSETTPSTPSAPTLLSPAFSGPTPAFMADAQSVRPGVAGSAPNPQQHEDTEDIHGSMKGVEGVKGAEGVESMAPDLLGTWRLDAVLRWHESLARLHAMLHACVNDPAGFDQLAALPADTARSSPEATATTSYNATSSAFAERTNASQASRPHAPLPFPEAALAPLAALAAAARATLALLVRALALTIAAVRFVLLPAVQAVLLPVEWLVLWDMRLVVGVWAALALIGPVYPSFIPLSIFLIQADILIIVYCMKMMQASGMLADAAGGLMEANARLSAEQIGNVAPPEMAINKVLLLQTSAHLAEFWRGKPGLAFELALPGLGTLEVLPDWVLQGALTSLAGCVMNLVAVVVPGVSLRSIAQRAYQLFMQEGQGQQEAAQKVDARPLYERIGGAEAVALAVDNFYERVLHDPFLEPYFRHVSLPHLKAKQIKFLTTAFGGPVIYDGAEIRCGHMKNMVRKGLSIPHFDAVVGHMIGTLSDLGVTASMLAEVTFKVAHLRSAFAIPSDLESATFLLQDKVTLAHLMQAATEAVPGLIQRAEAAALRLSHAGGEGSTGTLSSVSSAFLGPALTTDDGQGVVGGSQRSSQAVAGQAAAEETSGSRSGKRLGHVSKKGSDTTGAPKENQPIPSPSVRVPHTDVSGGVGRVGASGEVALLLWAEAWLKEMQQEDVQAATKTLTQLLQQQVAKERVVEEWDVAVQRLRLNGVGVAQYDVLAKVAQSAFAKVFEERAGKLFDAAITALLPLRKLLTNG